MQLTVRQILAVTIFLSTSHDLSCQRRSISDDFFQRRERNAFETIQKQIKASAAALDYNGPFLPDTQRLARKLQALLPEGRIQGQILPSAAWKRVEVRTRGWGVEVRAMPEMESAAHEMARYIASVEAAFQPGTMSGVSVGQARYFYGSLSIVFLRRNVVVWVSERDYPARVYPSAAQMAKECEGLALKVDHELLDLFSRK